MYNLVIFHVFALTLTYNRYWLACLWSVPISVATPICSSGSTGSHYIYRFNNYPKDSIQHGAAK